MGERNLKGVFKSLGTRTLKTARDKGFMEDPVVMDKVGAKLALAHSELTEVLEALRKDQGKDKVTEEFCDVFIRCLSLHEWLVEMDLATDDLDQRMTLVMDRNDAREALHGHRWG